MIENVRLLNFISHSDTSITLPPGISVFVGRNGAGKSSVIDGITYAMYGKHSRGNNESLVKDETSSGSASVQFTVGPRRFLVERKLDSRGQLQGAVLKELLRDAGNNDDGGGQSPGGFTSKQLASGERKQFGESTSAEVARVVGLDYDSMRIAAIIQQGELARIIDLKPMETKDLINGLIGIDQLGAAHDAVPDVLSSFRASVRAKYGCDDTELPSLETRATEQESVVKASEASLQSLGRELESLQKTEREGVAKLAEMEPLKSQAGLLQQQVQTLVDYVRRERSRLEQARRTLEETIRRGAASLRLLEEKEGSLREDKESVAEQESENEKAITELSGEIAALRVQRDRPLQIEKTVEKAREFLGLASREETITARLSTTGAELRDVEREIETLNEANGNYQGQLQLASKLEFKDHVCPMCGSVVERVRETFDKEAIRAHLAEHHSRLATLRARKDALAKASDEAKNESRTLQEAKRFLAENGIVTEGDVSRLEAERASLVQRLSSLPSINTRHGESLEIRARLRERAQALQRIEREVALARDYLEEHHLSSTEDIARLSLEKDDLAFALEGLPVDVDGLRRERDPARLSILAIDDQSKAMLAKVTELALAASLFNPAEYDRVSRGLEELRSVGIPQTSGQIERHRGDKERAEAELRTLGEKVAVAERALRYVRTLQLIREKVYHRDGPVSSSMRSWALNQIGLKASEYSRLFGIGVSSILLKENNREISIECHRPRGVVKVESLSGGEKVAIALALRFAMAYVMGGYKLDFVILDEPTVYLDEERRASMVEIISALGGEESPLRQMVIITHDAEIFENANIDALFQFDSTASGTVVTQRLRASQSGAQLPE
ncbi:MAG: SMC family ATPase [Nitrososphaerales archaeon]|jgi:exonuclease SbcC